MRTLTILGVGFVLGATLGFGGLYEYVLKPAKEKVVKLEEENHVMQNALIEAQTVIEEEAQLLSDKYLPKPMTALGLPSAEKITSELTSKPLGLNKKAKPLGGKARAERLNRMADKLRTLTKKDS